MDRRTRDARRGRFEIDAQAFAMLTANLDAAVAGGIIRLMCYAWGDGKTEPTLPGEPAELQRIAGIDANQWGALCAATIGQFICRQEDGRYYFVEQVMAFVHKQSVSSKRTRVGARGGSTKAARAETGRVLAITSADEIDGTWLQIRERYPKRQGDQSWREAERHYRAAITRGVTPAVMLAGVERYAAFVRAEGREGTKYVKQARTFFGPEKFWEESWAFTAAPVRTGPTSIVERMRSAANV